MLLRQYLNLRLKAYYGQPSAVVGSVTDSESPFPFLTHGRWQAWYGRKFTGGASGHWLTPVELFRPYYSRIVARQIKSATHVMEWGGGRGTNAREVLNVSLQLKSYTLMDHSPSLLTLQRQMVQEYRNGKEDKEGSTVNASSVDLNVRDVNLVDIAEGRIDFPGGPFQDDTMPSALLALEVLDNLPHDKVRFRHGRFEQAEVVTDRNSNGQQQQREVFRPLTDPVLMDVLRNYPFPPGAKYAWIPTIACSLLQKIPTHMSVVLADFDWLPPPTLSDVTAQQKPCTIRAVGEPLVTDTERKEDFPCYLSAPVDRPCDILFPTNFGALAIFVRQTRKKRGPKMVVSVRKQKDFLAQTAPDIVKETASRWTGYTPLLEDFANCSVLTIGAPPNE